MIRGEKIISAILGMDISRVNLTSDDREKSVNDDIVKFILKDIKEKRPI